CRVVLGRKKYRLVSAQRGFKRAYAGRASDNKCDHCIGKHHDVPDRDHRASNHVCWCAVVEFVHHCLESTCFLEDREGGASAFNHLAGHDKLFHFSVRRKHVHHVEHQFFEYHSQPASAHFALAR